MLDSLPPVKKDINRILDLPVQFGYSKQDRAKFTEIFKGRTIELRDIQVDALLTVFFQEAGFFPIGVGWGKTIISVFSHIVGESKRCLLFVPSKLVKQLTEVDIPWMEYEFGEDVDWCCLSGHHISERKDMMDKCRLTIIPYSLLSQPDAWDLLDASNADMVVSDECHLLKRKSSARTKRVLGFLREHPEIRFIPMSGTITRNSLLDYWHLISRATGDKNPLPKTFAQTCSWEEVIGVVGDYPVYKIRDLEFLAGWYGEQIQQLPQARGISFYREAIKYRIQSSPMVNATADQSCDASIEIETIPLTPGKVLKDAIKTLGESWVDPNGDEIADQIVFNQRNAQLHSGFFYRLVWPEGTPEWMIHAHEAKNELLSEMRSWFKGGLRKGHDTPMLVFKSLKARSEYVRKLQPAYDLWHRILNGREPHKRDQILEWVDPFKITAAVSWARKEKIGIIWYKWDAVGELLRDKIPGAEYCPAGCKEVKLLQEKVLICSIAHGVGKNLQHHNKQLFVDVPRAGLDWEQNLGRTHRQGQKEDTVFADVLIGGSHDDKGLCNSIEQARYLDQTGSGAQKLLIADYSDGKYKKIARGQIMNPYSE